MKILQTYSDKAAIGLSLLCAIHCLFFPLLLLLLPSVAALELNNEAFHLWMVIIVIPISAYALTLGCREHSKYRLIAIGSAGLACLIVAVALSESVLGEIGEKTLTMIGAGIISYAHFRNFRLCQTEQNCTCYSEEAGV